MQIMAPTRPAKGSGDPDGVKILRAAIGDNVIVNSLFGDDWTLPSYILPRHCKSNIVPDSLLSEQVIEAMYSDYPLIVNYTTERGQGEFIFEVPSCILPDIQGCWGASQPPPAGEILLETEKVRQEIEHVEPEKEKSTTFL